MKTRFGSIACALALTLGCGANSQPAGPLTGLVDPSSDRSFDADGGTSGSPGKPGNASGDGNAVSGLPCDVANLLMDKCVSCHGAKPAGGAPMSLTSAADLAATPKDDPSKSYAALSLERMRSTSAPMPPSGTPASATEIAAFEAWLTAGMPAGDCGGVTDPYATPVTCTSDTYWTRGDHEDPRMHPGHACIDCHTNGAANDEGEFERGPRFSIAGTLYPSAHEPDDCNGVDGSNVDVMVEITDATGRVVPLYPNSAGNFYYEDGLTFPIKARVVAGGKERVMQTAQSSGDCNSCHTESGTMDAPGRILMP